MRNTPVQNELAEISRVFAIALGLLFAIGSSVVSANELNTKNEAANRTAVGFAGALEYLLVAHPAVGRVNQPRTVFLNQPRPICPLYDFSLDISAMESNNLVVLRKVARIVLCPSVGNPPELARFEFVVTPTKVGLLTIRDENSKSEITIQTVPASPLSKFDVNGMWFDAATNGSGIALHHRRSTTDIAFGTWFLYNNNGESRWVSFQSTNWQQDGSVLEGLLIETRGGCQLPSLVACPASGTFRTDPPQDLFSVTPSRARITFQSATRARAEVLTLSGAVLFTSELTKLQF